MARLLAQIGTCQLWLGRKSEAEKSFSQSYQTLLNMVPTDSNGVVVDALASISNNILVEYNNVHDLAGSELWLQRMDEAVGRMVAHPECAAVRADELQARLAVNRAIVLSAKKRAGEADKAYREFLKYNYAKTDNGLMFITMFIGLADLKTGHFDFCNAGHNPPVMAGEFLEMLPNAPIGLWPGLEFEGETIENIKGQPLFIYTDGLNEAENGQLEQFGDDRLLSVLRTVTFENAHQVIDTLKAEVELHRNGADPNDDLTMMCIRLSPV